jgi:hypothetical protein
MSQLHEEFDGSLRGIVYILILVVAAIAVGIGGCHDAETRFDQSTKAYKASERAYAEWYGHPATHKALVEAAIAGTLPLDRIDPKERSIVAYAHEWLHRAPPAGSDEDGPHTISVAVASRPERIPATHNKHYQDCSLRPPSCKLKPEFKALDSAEVLRTLRDHPPQPPVPPEGLSDFVWHELDPPSVPWSYRGLELAAVLVLASLIRTAIGLAMQQSVLRPVSPGGKILDLLLYPLHFAWYRLEEMAAALARGWRWLLPGPLGWEVRAFRKREARLLHLKGIAEGLNDTETAQEIALDLVDLERAFRRRIRGAGKKEFEDAREALGLTAKDASGLGG